MPKKCRDPSTFTIPCTIEECTLAYAMLDLGASIDAMPSSVYKSLNFGDLEPIGVMIQLVKRSIAHPLDMEDEPSSKGSTLILARPFLMTTRTKIEVHVGTLSMEFSDNMLHISLTTISEFSDVIDVADVSNFPDFANFECMCDRSKECSICAKNCVAINEGPKVAKMAEVGEVTKVAASKPPSPPSPVVELKPLPEHLKYAYLEDDQKLLVIIANNLQSEQEERLLHVLRKHMKAIGWILVDLPTINPSICMHRILLEEEAQPVRQP
ncbi:hypothetical protein CR513_10370, partial [Mucuna pruriens]